MNTYTARAGQGAKWHYYVDEASGGNASGIYWLERGILRSCDESDVEGPGV